MNAHSIVLTSFSVLCAATAGAQVTVEKPATVPIYQVTVIERTVRAVNYQYRTLPTKIDFRGTVLMPEVKGDATVESKRGRTEVDAKLEHLSPPTRFGREYLTYVLWAITPEGHAKNLGEVIPGGSDRAKLRVTTDLQAFGLIVTAEPYSAVRQPSDVVVAENEIRPDTVGTSEPIRAKYELLPRGHYTYYKPEGIQIVQAAGPKMPMDEYEALLEVYQAQNALQIAKSMGAAEYAGDTYGKSEQLLLEAQRLQAVKAGPNMVVTVARQAAQTAEDARTLALRRKEDAELAQARADVTAAQRQKAEAEAAAQRAQAEAAAARARLEAERAAREQADRAATPLPTSMIEQPQRAATQPAPPPPSQVNEVRRRMFQQLSAVCPTRDTPRGLVVTISDSYFHGGSLNPAIYGRLAGIAAVVREQPGLFVEVEGHTDDRGDALYSERISLDRASTIRQLLVRQGIPETSIAARGFGKSRPVAPNATAAGREQNRRVEIVISGAPIGYMAAWERSYSLAPSR